MPQSGTSITRSSIINDFISGVMQPARNTSRWYTGNFPTINNRVWESGSVIAWSPYNIVNTEPFTTQERLMDDPNNGNITTLFPDFVTAYVITDVLRQYARNTSVIRRIQMGLYYTVYTDGVQTGVPSDNPNAHIGGRITGVAIGSHPTGIDFGHLHSGHMVDNSYVQGPTRDNTISAPELNNFISNLRSAANAATNGSPIVDLRICHSSCHNNCHSSRGRR